MHLALSRQSWSGVLGSVALVALVGGVFGQTATFDFITYDDPLYVSENPHLSDGLTPGAIAWAFTTTHAGYRIPITWLSHLTDVELFGLQPGGHHMTSVAIHATNTVMLFWLLLCIRTVEPPVRAGSRLVAGAGAAALFAVHPLHVESVAWVAERKDVLSAGFWLLAVGGYVRYTRSTGARRRAWYLVTLLLFALGLASKPMLVTLPLTLLVIDFWPLGRLRHGEPWSRLVAEKVPLFVLASAAAIGTLVTQSMAGAVSSLDQLPVAVRLTSAVTAYGTYLVRAVWPVGLSGFYPLTNEPAWLAATVSLGFIVVVTWLTLRASRRRPYLLAGWLWFLVTLVPVSGFVQAGVQATADRFTYVPLIGIFVMVAWGAADLAERWGTRTVWLGMAAVSVVTAAALAAHAQVGHWRDGPTFWRRAAATSFGVGHYEADMALGTVMVQQARLPEAVAHFERARELRPDLDAPRHALTEAYRAMGLDALSSGRLDEAVARLQQAVAADERRADVRNDLGLALARSGRYADARDQLVAAIQIQPDLAEAHNNLGMTLAATGRLEDAHRAFAEAVRLAPGLINGRINLARSLVLLGRPAEARLHLDEVLTREPSNPVAQALLAQIGR